MNITSIQWFDLSLIISIAISLFLNILIVYLWDNKVYKKLGIKNYQSIQRIHLRETPRLGGFTFLISLLGFVIYSNDTQSILFLKLIFISLIPIIVIGLKEDLFQNVKPSIRLLSLIFVGWLFTVQFTGPFPNLTEVPFVNNLLMAKGGVSFFYILGMVAIANGMNMIDGVNGLCSAVAITILSALLFLSHKTGDVTMMSTSFSTIILLTPFIIMNYPYGKIFLGDLGAYSLGIIVSVLTIIFFGRHPEISPWGAVLVLIYPITEILFSLLRRMIRNLPIYTSDTEHLHIKLYFFLRPHTAYKNIANGLVTPVLSALWLFPLLTIPWVYNKTIFIWIVIILFLICYGLIYLILPTSKKVNLF